MALDYSCRFIQRKMVDYRVYINFMWQHSVVHNNVVYYSAYVMDSMSHSLNDSTISTVKHIESFLRMYDPQVSPKPPAYEARSTRKDLFTIMCLSLKVPSQSGVDCGVHTMHNVGVAVRVSYSSQNIINNQNKTNNFVASTCWLPAEINITTRAKVRCGRVEGKTPFRLLQTQYLILQVAIILCLRDSYNFAIDINRSITPKEESNDKLIVKVRLYENKENQGVCCHNRSQVAMVKLDRRQVWNVHDWKEG